jgi:hypothetical protein
MDHTAALTSPDPAPGGHAARRCSSIPAFEEAGESEDARFIEALVLHALERKCDDVLSYGARRGDDRNSVERVVFEVSPFANRRRTTWALFREGGSGSAADES